LIISYIALLVLIVLIVIVFIRIKKQKELIEKAKQYEKLLRESRISRFKYQQSLEKSREFLKTLEQINESLRVIKAELESIRSDLRKHVEGVRSELKKTDNSDLDKRILNQMKTVLGEKWKFFNTRKLDCNKIRDKLKDMEKERNEIAQAEQAACEKWTMEKETVLKTWKELNTQIKITNPQKYYV
jgi:hypothetical protein